MRVDVQISHFATWTSGGVAVDSAPVAESGRQLAKWPDAPDLARIHPKGRKPLFSVQALLQLTYALDSSVDRGSVSGRTSVILGTLAGCAETDRQFSQSLLERGPAFGSPTTFVYTLPTAALAEVAIALNIKGEVLTVSAGNASGLTAVAMAADRISSGNCAACICGGMELGTDRDWIALFLLEPSKPGRRSQLDSWETGFGQLPRQPLEYPAPLELATQLALLSNSKTGSGRTASSDGVGYWASLTVSRMGRDQ